MVKKLQLWFRSRSGRQRLIDRAKQLFQCVQHPDDPYLHFYYNSLSHAYAWEKPNLLAHVDMDVVPWKLSQAAADGVRPSITLDSSRATSVETAPSKPGANDQLSAIVMTAASWTRQ